MEPLMFVMAILGCGESDAACREVRVVETHYRSEAECLAATESELMRHQDLVYPSVVAQCRPAIASPRLVRGSDVMLPEGGTLTGEPPRLADAQTAERPNQ